VTLQTLAAYSAPACAVADPKGKDLGLWLIGMRLRSGTGRSAVASVGDRSDEYPVGEVTVKAERNMVGQFYRRDLCFGFESVQYYDFSAV